jgi:hypothetical protein
MAEIKNLKSQIHSLSSGGGQSTGRHDAIVAHQGDLMSVQELQFAKEATETKYNKLKAEFQDFMSERRQVLDVLNAFSLGPPLGGDVVDLPSLVTSLCDKIASSESSRVLSVDVDRTRNNLAKTEAEIVELHRAINQIRKQDNKKAELLEENDRHLKILQEENLDLIQKLKIVRKERDTLKARNHTLQKQASTEGCLSGIAADKTKFHSSQGLSPVRSAAKAKTKTPVNHSIEKENCDNVHARSSTKRTTPAGRLPQKKPKITDEMNAVYGPADEPTGECKQS